MSAVLAVAAVAILLAGCSDSDDGDADAADGGGTTTTEPVAIPEERAVVIDALLAVDNADLKMGAEFNRRFLALQLGAVGMLDDEIDCLIGIVEDDLGDRFATTAISEVFTEDVLRPEVVVRCVPEERMTQFGAAASDQAEVSTEYLALVESVLTELTAGGFESAGLEAPEATCLAGEVISRFEGENLLEALATEPLDRVAVDASLDACLTDARIGQLAVELAG